MQHLVIELIISVKGCENSLQIIVVSRGTLSLVWYNVMRIEHPLTIEHTIVLKACKLLSYRQVPPVWYGTKLRVEGSILQYQ